ncbi:MAG TPA: metal-dependent hydrolase [Longimicrobium sp.]|jgi:membrane-bound metal-dependent hydrolase YbcI (DUF457 family)
MAFPPAHFLIGAGFAEVARASSRRPPPRWAAWAVGGCAAALPDVDIVLGIARGASGAYHGTFTHSVAAAVVWALIGYAFGGGRWAAVVGVGYGSHLLVDLLDDSGPTNLMLGWPFSGARPYSLGRFFPKVPVEGDGLVDTALNVLRPDALSLLLQQTLLAAACAGALFLLAAAIRRARTRRAGAADAFPHPPA